MSIYDQEAPEGKFLRFKHGTVARLRLFGEAISFTKSFKPNEEPKQRFASLCLFRDKDRKTSDLKVLEFGWEIQKRLRAFAKDADWGDPTTYDIEITATGDGLDREYQVVPKPKGELDKESRAIIEGCDWNLEEMCKPKESPKSGEYDPYSDV